MFECFQLSPDEQTTIGADALSFVSPFRELARQPTRQLGSSFVPTRCLHTFSLRERGLGSSLSFLL